jgi:hypothetical protein
MPIKGLGDLSKKLDQLTKNAKDLGDTKLASLTDILTPAFISQHTRFAGVDELFEAGGFNVNSQSDFEAIPEEKLSAFIRSESSFGSWQEMLNAAGAVWAKRKLGL